MAYLGNKISSIRELLSIVIVLLRTIAAADSSEHCRGRQRTVWENRIQTAIGLQKGFEEMLGLESCDY